MTTNALIMLVALALESRIGWPEILNRRIRHPVAWFGALINVADRGFNRTDWPHRVRYLAGGMATIALVAGAFTLGWIITRALPDTLIGRSVEALLAASLVAARSLHDHVMAVHAALTGHGLEAGRNAVAHIVGRDVGRLDEAGVVRAALESLAENASDGVIAPLFWGTLFGLPGLAAYKAINTCDSMIGHRTARHMAFGGVAARLDDLANLLPARLTGLLFGLSAGRIGAVKVMARDARRHRSPNAGWPEAALAGALDIRLSGPRAYGDALSTDPWLNAGARNPGAKDLLDGLALYRRIIWVTACSLGFIFLMGVPL